MLELDGYDELMRELDRIDRTLRRRTTRDVARAMAEVVATRAKQLCPRGDPAHNPDAKPLAETIGIEVRDYGERQLAVVGPQVPAGAHGHNVENGHAIVRNGQVVGRAAPHPFIRPAADETQSEQQAAAEAVATQAVQDLGLTG